MQRHGAKATQKIRSRGRSLFSRPFACICIYNVYRGSATSLAKYEEREGGKRGRLFSREEWLTKAQIKGFFFCLSSSRWRRAGSSPSTAVDDKSDEELIDEEEVNHMTTVESVVTEIGLTHPIVYDIYDLCDYVKEEKLNYFTVSMLKEICTFFELPFKWESCRGMGRRQPKKLGAGGGAYLAGLLHVFVYTM